jgi:purine-binding chemotaxis protein CheW
MSAPGKLNTRKTQLSVKGAQSEPRNYYVAFALNKEVFAVEIRFVKEILQYDEPTEVPLMPPFVRGVINLRGAVVPVLDLSIRFERPPTQVAQRTCVVILEVPQAGKVVVIGVMVDSVSEVMELAPSEIEPAPSTGADPKSQFICGIAKVRNRFVILLDAARILSAAEVSQLAQESTSGVVEP